MVCAICLSEDGFGCDVKRFGSYDAELYDCQVCGTFTASRTAIDESLTAVNSKITRVIRAILSHRTRLNAGDLKSKMITTYVVDQLIQSDSRLPSPAQQSINAVRYIGDILQQSFQPIQNLSPCFQAVIGAPTRHYALKLVRELELRGITSFIDAKSMGNPYDVVNVDLTLSGWDMYDKEQKGEIASKIGFIALKFGDTVLDPFLRDVIKPGVRALGYELIDLRDVSQAGIIDNILRAQIRDSAFVIVDLTHDNSGAYWEAGYAEGLGKPVVYICERSKFDDRKTHFDTNHCTTVIWNLDEPGDFVEQLNATIRRALDYN